jgi:hypothetical protein
MDGCLGHESLVGRLASPEVGSVLGDELLFARHPLPRIRRKRGEKSATEETDGAEARDENEEAEEEVIVLVESDQDET